MQYAHKKICSLEKALVEDHIEEEKNRSYRGQEVKTLEKEHKTIEKNRGQKKTPMQQISTEEEEEIEYAICMESGAIQPKTVGKEREERRKQQNSCKSWQKTMENSELLTGLLKYIQCIAFRKTGK